MKKIKRTCKLKGCNNTFYPKCARQRYCSIKCGNIAHYLDNERQRIKNLKGQKHKPLKMPNGLELADNAISSGVLSK